MHEKRAAAHRFQEIKNKPKEPCSIYSTAMYIIFQKGYHAYFLG